MRKMVKRREMSVVSDNVPSHHPIDIPALIV